MFFAFDIETTYPDQSVIDAELALWKPTASAKKDETKEKQRVEAETRIREKSALLRDAPITTAVFMSEQGMPFAFTTLKAGTNNCFQWDSEREMLIGLREWLDAWIQPEMLLVGFNCLKFDLPHLRWAYVRHGLRWPGCLLNEDHPIADVMRRFLWVYGADQPFIGLDEVAQRLKIGSKEGITGKMAADWAQDPARHRDVVDYCRADTWLTVQAWLKLNGQIGG